MTKLRNQIATVSALAVVALILLAGVLVTIRPALAQTSNTCAAGTAVPDPDNNPGLVSDCEALLGGTRHVGGYRDTELVGGYSRHSDWDGMSPFPAGPCASRSWCCRIRG